jgi:mycothiol synthase
MNTFDPGEYTARPIEMGDLHTAVEMLNAYTLTQVDAKENNPESLRSDWQSPGFDMSRDLFGIFTRQGQMVGYSEFFDQGEPHVVFSGWSGVHPAHWGRGLGRRLLEWSINRARENVSLAPADARVVLHHHCISTNQAAVDLFTAHGFEHVRTFYIMQIDFDQQPQQPVLPDRITIRAVSGEKEIRDALFTAHEAFKDHWGSTNQSFEEYYSRTRHEMESDPYYDPSLLFIALDGKGANTVGGANGTGAIAGVSLCYLHRDEDHPDLAWVRTLGVLEPWRKRGIGLALLQHSFCEFYRRGKRCAGLGVDASSLTGAVGLYERAGMRILRKNVLYELELRQGIDLMKRN